tara:strand:+ start:7171 stop:7932 length:762 start_codon:yes stop_codon:yes gene_type:complete
MPAHAEKSPKAGPVDNRIRTIVYSPRDVTEIRGHYGYQTLIEFNRDEAIQNIALGDSMAWYVNPNEEGNLLFVKPVEDNATTNLTVVTSKRTYHFELNASAANGPHAKNMAFHVQFKYPENTSGFIERPIADQSQGNNIPPSAWNFDYEFAGHTGQVPKRTFDDGDFTYFEFDKQTEVPAIFSVAANGTESLINYTIEGRYVVVHSIGKQFTLRNAKSVTCIFNRSYDPAPELNGASPRPLGIVSRLLKAQGA